MRKKIFIVAFVIVLIFLLNFFSFKNSLKNLFFSLTQPVNRFFTDIAFSLFSFNERLKNQEKLSVENNLLKEKIKKLEEQIVRFDELEKENQFLRESLNLAKKNKNLKTIIAEVMGVYPFDDKILINKGKEDGVEKGMMVILENTGLVGQVDEVFDNFAKVLLISNANFSLSAKIFNKEIFGLIRGAGAGRVFLDRIFKEEGEIEAQDIVVSWQTERVPSGFLIGKIKKNSISNERVEIEPYFSLSQIRWVLILTEFKK